MTDTDTIYEADQDLICEWFARCTNETRLGLSHPVLGVVPICQRCLDKVQSMRR